MMGYCGACMMVTTIVLEGLLICVYEWVTLVYWVIRACANFIRGCHVF